MYVVFSQQNLVSQISTQSSECYRWFGPILFSRLSSMRLDLGLAHVVGVAPLISLFPQQVFFFRRFDCPARSCNPCQGICLLSCSCNPSMCPGLRLDPDSFFLFPLVTLCDDSPQSPSFSYGHALFFFYPTRIGCFMWHPKFPSFFSFFSFRPGPSNLSLFHEFALPVYGIDVQTLEILPGYSFSAPFDVFSF